MATNNTDQGRGTPPVCIPCGNLPDNTENGIQYTVREPGAAAQKTRGYNLVIGPQKIRGLWRTYPIIYVSMDAPFPQNYLFIWMLSSRLTIKTYFSIQLFVCMPIHAPAHQPTCSF